MTTAAPRIPLTVIHSYTRCRNCNTPLRLPQSITEGACCCCRGDHTGMRCAICSDYLLDTTEDNGLCRRCSEAYPSTGQSGDIAQEGAQA